MTWIMDLEYRYHQYCSLLGYSVNHCLFSFSIHAIGHTLASLSYYRFSDLVIVMCHIICWIGKVEFLLLDFRASEYARRATRQSLHDRQTVRSDSSLAEVTIAHFQHQHKNINPSTPTSIYCFRPSDPCYVENFTFGTVVGNSFNAT